MLQLKNISKTYKNGDNITTALNDVNLSFEKNEFVSILGGSGCGKSTMLNIIGGLMEASYGELFIDNYSTKNFKDTDWDSYRNHYIGFVFQSYHLIPHLNIIENIELTLSLAGLPKKEKGEMSLNALREVGLGEHAKKRPNQLSNGQVQRVAIARAIVHNPEIILADEPTGALDSKNSKQIMSLLKRISKDKLVIMVTHNEGLAYRYSTRIIKIEDGEVLSDEKNTPTITIEDILNDDKIPDIQNKIINDTQNENNATFNETRDSEIPTENVKEILTEKIVDEINNEEIEKKKHKSKLQKEVKVKAKPSMSPWEAMKLSLKNLWSQIGRTIMTVIAGAIAIISIAIVLGFNNGFNNYIDDYEKQSLAQYPITIQKSNSTFTDLFKNIGELANTGNFDPSNINFGQILDALKDEDTSKEEYIEVKKIYSTTLLHNLLKNNKKLTKNNNTALLREYLNKNLTNEMGFMKCDYDLSLNVYSKINEQYVALNPFMDRFNVGLKSLGASINEEMKASLTKSLSDITIWEQMPNLEIIKSQYDLIGGEYPTGENSKFEVLLKVDKYNSLNDYVLYALGLVEMKEVFASLMNEKALTKEFNFNKVLGKEYKIMLPTDYYIKNETTQLYDKAEGEQLQNQIKNKAITVKIKGIIREKKGVAKGCLKGSICFLEELSKYYIEQNQLTPLVLEQMQIYNKFMLDANDTTIELDDKQKLLSVLSSFQTIQLTLNATSAQNKKNFFLYLNEDLGVKDVTTPEYIYLYANDVKAKNEITNCLENFNKANSDDEVSYMDNSTALVNSLTSTVDTITYIFIAVTLIAVVVALFMIGILMYSTVQDRTQEIGILRSIGARKLDIMRIFNVESILLGFFSSIVGILLSLIISIPINIVLKGKLGITNLVTMAWWHPLVLIGFSVILTLISGLIPALIAAKKDPVIALKTE